MKFFDSFGNEVTAGSHIKIIRSYNYQHWNGQDAEVVWDEKHGQYQFIFFDSQSKTAHDFWGIHQFKVI